MTKIKNTKKGMAKKTLSMSLVVAMLATSNVPVWAAEFSDGSDVAVATEAPAEFTDETEATPVVEDNTEEVSVAQVAAGYTVNTNMELKAGDWATGLTFAKKDGVASTDTDVFEVLDKNTVPVNVTKAEIYSGTDLLKSVNVAGGDVVAALKSEKVGLDAYKNSKQVTVKFYVTGENEAVFEQTATVKPVTLDDTWTVNTTATTAVYNGTVQAPTVTVTKAGYTDPASVIVKFDGEKEAKNVGEYTFSVEGKEADGYVGTIKNSTYKYKITPAPVLNAKGEPNISIQISGTASYNGQASKPTVVVTDNFTNTVISSELYNVAGETAVGNHKEMTVTLKADNGKTGTELLTNNFAAGPVDSKTYAKCYSGSYKVEALDLSKLADKYNVTIATKKVGEAVSFGDITLTDKATGKTVNTSAVLGAFTNVSDVSNTLVTIVTSNNTAVGTGKVIIRSTTASSTAVVNEFSANYTVVNAKITASDLSFPAGTKVGTTTLKKKEDLLNAISFKDPAKTQLKDETYTGAAIEPYKEAFSNLVLKNSATVTDQKLVLGTDYDIVYANNTDSKDVSGKTSTVKLVFKGSYAGTISYDFVINKANAVVSGKDIEYTAGKKAYDVSAKVITMVDGKEVAVPEKEYDVVTTVKGTLENNKAEGLVVFNNKNYTITGGQVKDGYYYTAISSNIVAKNLKNCTATVEGTYVYTGESVSPKLVVKDGDTVLVEGTDYIVTSKTGTNAGPAHVTITGKGHYTGTLTADYTIAKANLANATIVSKAADKKNLDVTYTGYPAEFKAKALESVKIGNAVLDEYDLITKKGDYTVSWDKDATEVGTYNFTITAVPGNTKVEGEYKGTFKIVPASIDAGFAPKLNAKYTNIVAKGTVLESKGTGAYYTGKAITIDSFKTKYVVVDKNSNILTEGKDYELRYTNNVNAGVATVEAFGIGNHKNVNAKTGKEEAIATLQYNIDPTAVITNDMVQKISDVEYAGGLPVEPQVVIVDEKGNRLVQGVDYTVETKITEVTTATDPTTGKLILNTGADVIIKGKGAYLTATKAGGKTTINYDNAKLTGLSSKTWKVTKKDLANTTVSVDKNNNVTVINGTVVVPSSEYDVKFSEDGKKVTVTAKANSKHYTGSKELEVNATKVGAPMINDVKVVGNKATVILSGEAEGASGYDYVISTDRDCITNKDYASVNKNQVQTSTTFKYVQKGVYYAYCHAWTRDENGKKVFGEWSNAYPFSVTAITPDAPVITNVKVSGSTIKVTYKAAANATGYDVVLGTDSRKENGETRPYNYGAHKKLNLKEGTVTATFKNVPKGTWVVGMHAFNRTSEDGKKVFSPWSNLKKATVK